MSIEGIDYAWGYNSRVPAALHKAGLSFVIRYLGTSSKCLTAAEAKALHAGGIHIGLVYEVTGLSFKGGYNAGLADGKAAAEAAKRLGVPDGALIWFAIDTDTSNYSAAKAYLKGCQAATGGYKAYLYAGRNVVDAVGGGLHWQTYAWSGGKISKNAVMYQYKNDVTVAGLNSDRCRTINAGVASVDGWLCPLGYVKVVQPAAPAAPSVPQEITVGGHKYRLEA